MVRVEFEWHDGEWHGEYEDAQGGPWKLRTRSGTIHLRLNPEDAELQPVVIVGLGRPTREMDEEVAGE